MSRNLAIILAILLTSLALASLGGLVWTNRAYASILPVNKDFLVPWLGARTFIQYGQSPYGDPATQRAQIIYYGRLASANQDPLTLWLPFPIELLYFPIALVPDYTLARALWMTCLEIAMVALAFFSLRLTGWNPGRLFLPLVLLFPILWVYGSFSLLSGNATGLVALALVGFLLALKNEREELAGVLMILVVSAPRLTGVLAFFILWWVIHGRRWRILWGFLMGVAILLGLAFLFLPGWLPAFFPGLISHFAYNPGFSLISILASWSPVVGRRLGWAVAAILLLVLFFEWGNTLRKDFRSLLWTVSLTVSVTPLLGLPMVSTEFSFLIIPLVVFLAILAERRPRTKRWGLTGIVLASILAGLWAMTFGLVRANAFLSLANTLFLLLPVVLVICLYWVRWWFVHVLPSGLETPR